MFWLCSVTVIWAFSFSLIGEYLAGQVDPYIAVTSRMLLATLLLLPFLKPRSTSIAQAVALMAIGAVQLGLMYLCFYHSFLYLSVPQVLLFTILTPLYVTVLDRLWRQQPLQLKWLGPAALAVAGALVIRYQQPQSNFWLGFMLVQAANLSFAFGQVAYRQLNLNNFRQQLHSFGWFFIGASLVGLFSCYTLANWQKVPDSPIEFAVLLWLGIVASGLGYLGWNAGARQVSANQLAVMNNLLIPAGLFVNFILWQQQVSWLPFGIGSSMLLLSLAWSYRLKQ